MLKQIFALILCLGIIPLTAHSKMRYDKNATVFPARVNEYANSFPVLFAQGYLDITKAPYSAVNDGSKETSLAIQQAINDAFASNLVVYVPRGTYLLGKPLRLLQSITKLGMGQRKFAHILMGPPGLSRENRPVFKLGASISSPLVHYAWVYRKSNTGANEKVEVTDSGELKIGSETVNFSDLIEDSSRHYNAHFRDINIDLGNHPGAIGLHMNGAQYCVVENVRIFGENFAVGLKNLPGSGGSVTNLEVIGGDVGIEQNDFRPTPSVHGLRLLNQKITGLDLKLVRGSVTLLGFEIISPASAPSNYRAIRMNRPVNLVNGRIIVKNSTSAAIDNINWDIYAQNVSYQAKRFAYSHGGGTNLVVDGSSSEERLINEYIFASSKSPLVLENWQSLQQTTAWHQVKGNLKTLNLKDHVAQVLESYHLFDYSVIGSSDFIDVTKPNNAYTGVATPDDASDDDAPAISAALRSAVDGPNKGRAVFLPRGHYHVRTPVVVPEGTRLLGASNTISVITVDAEKFNFQGDYFSSIVKVEKNETSLKPAILSDFAIFAEAPQKEPTVTEFPKGSRISYLRIKGLTHLRDVQLTQHQQGSNGLKNAHAAPIIHFQEGAGGDFYNLGYDEYTAAAVKPSFAVMKMEKNAYPINLFQPYLEATGPYSANLWLQETHQIKAYGYKFEDSGQILRINGSNLTEIYGASGNVHFPAEDIPSKPLISISSNSNFVKIVGLVPKPMENGVVPLVLKYSSDNNILVYKKSELPNPPERRVRRGLITP